MEGAVLSLKSPASPFTPTTSSSEEANARQGTCRFGAYIGQDTLDVHVDLGTASDSTSSRDVEQASDSTSSRDLGQKRKFDPASDSTSSRDVEQAVVPCESPCTPGFVKTKKWKPYAIHYR